MSKHTATPWRIGDAGLTIFGPPNGKPSPVHVAYMVQTPDYRANSAFIVQACNAHDDLVAALERIERACEPGSSQSEDELYKFIANIRKIARAALAKAQK